ncbi:MAG: SagB/ThcOx family dehydrogenase, partial [Xenococcaceae cyanobacterium]
MSNLPVSIASHYHERTKYAPETIATKSKTLDWENQPVPFKEYKIGNTYELTTYLSRQEDLAGERLAWQRLSRLLLCSYGLTAKMPTMYGPPLYLRSAPSAGGLYPAELYLISRGTAILPAGLYNYQPQNHSLIHFWEDNVWSQLQTACFENSALEETELAIVTTAIFFRSAWRYEDRAYRRIFLDTGHLLGNVELAAAINHYRPHLIGGFKDEAIDKLLYLDRQIEGVITVIPLSDLLDAKQVGTTP